ncbi:MAG: hypothetical protein SGPRY_012442 [Prymnesium sp.]
MLCPALSADLVPSSAALPHPSTRWQPVPAPSHSPNNSNIFMFLPDISSEEDAQAMRARLRSNQFPADAAACDRVLLLSDDAIGTGLGYTARLLMIALLVAVKEQRVLMSVPHRTNRWCDKPPYTLNCLYERWSHCPLPTNTSSGGKWNHRGSWRQGPSSPIMRISTSQIHKESFFMKTHPAPEVRAAAFEILFRPRAWVREAAHCAMRNFDLRPGNFLVLHVRYSSEKKKERGVGLPPLSAYMPAAYSAMRRHNLSTIFLQASAQAHSTALPSDLELTVSTLPC